MQTTYKISTDNTVQQCEKCKAPVVISGSMHSRPISDRSPHKLCHSIGVSNAAYLFYNAAYLFCKAAGRSSIVVRLSFDTMVMGQLIARGTSSPFKARIAATMLRYAW